MDTDAMLKQWEKDVMERVKMLWMRAVRLCEDYDRHIDYVPGCVWSKPRVNHREKFKETWQGVLGQVVQEEWVAARLLP